LKIRQFVRQAQKKCTPEEKIFSKNILKTCSTVRCIQLAVFRRRNVRGYPSRRAAAVSRSPSLGLCRFGRRSTRGRPLQSPVVFRRRRAGFAAAFVARRFRCLSRHRATRSASLCRGEQYSWSNLFRTNICLHRRQRPRRSPPANIGKASAYTAVSRFSHQIAGVNCAPDHQSTMRASLIACDTKAATTVSCARASASLAAKSRDRLRGLEKYFPHRSQAPEDRRISIGPTTSSRSPQIAICNAL
jgi:hypothetical protein